MTGPTVIKLAGIESLAAAAVQMLGFVPAESLVLMTLAGPRKRIEFTQRIDLDVAVPMLPSLFSRAVYSPVEGICAVIFTDTPGDLPYAEVAAAVSELSPVPVLDVLLARAGRVWSYTCTDPDCCPVEGKLIAEAPSATALDAAYALRGRATMPSRAAVEAELAAPDVDLTVAAGVDVTAVARYADPQVLLTDAEVAGWVDALDDVRVRDGVLGVLGHTHAEDLDAYENVLAQLVHRVPAGRDASVCTVAAIAYYLNGDGLRAQILLDRALHTDPGYALARLVSTTLNAGIKPSAVRTLLGLL